MSSYIIGYDLNKTGQDYADLITTIKNTFTTWWHYLDSTWIVTTEELSSKDIRDLLKPHIDSNDELLVAKLTGEGAWTGFAEKASTWLKENL